MIQGLYTAASGMAAQLDKLDILTNNLANVDTAGFKADLVTVDPSGAPPDALSGSSSPTMAVKVGRHGLDTSPGILRQTGNPFDLAIMGPGLFVVETPQGERYTRAGTFVRDAQGFLVTPDGFRVLGSAGPIRIPPGGLRLTERGQSSDGNSLRIVAGPDASSLVKVGANLYAPAEGASAPPELPDPTVLQGRWESSNVNPVRSMVEILATLRAYEAHQRSVQAFDQTLGEAANDLGRA